MKRILSICVLAAMMYLPIHADETYVNQYQTAIMEIFAGGEMPADMVRPADISEEYAQAFMRYYTRSKTDQIIPSKFRSMTNMLIEAMRKEGTQNPEAIVERMVQYTDRNMPVVLMAACYETLTMEELEESQKPLELGIDIMTRVVEWMYLHFPLYEDNKQQ